MGRIIDRRRVMGGKLPYDTEIEYLASNGTQYITIDYYSNNNTDIYCEVEYKSYSTTTTPDTFGNRGYIALMHWAAGPSFVGGFRGMTTSNFGQGSTKINIGYKYIIHVNKDTFLINTTDHCATPSTISFICPSKFQIFGISNESYSHPSIKIYRFIIKEGDNVLFDLTPVRVGTTGYMYDKVSKQLFGNTGTGSFILGPDKGDFGIKVITHSIDTASSLDVITGDEEPVNILWSDVRDTPWANEYIQVKYNLNAYSWEIYAITSCLYDGQVYNSGDLIATWRYYTSKTIDIIPNT